MKADQLTEIGTIKRAHGLKGELKVDIDSFYFDDILEMDAIILKKGDSFLPFFIEQFQPQANQTILKLESIQSKEEATSLNGQSIYALTKHLSNVRQNLSDELLGLPLVNQANETIGKIIAIQEMPTQLLLTVLATEKEILIPYHQEMLIKHTETELQLELPEGLYDL